MASLLFTVGGAVVNALAFSVTNFVFIRLMNHGEKERKRYDLALGKLQRELQSLRAERDDDRMKRFDFINKRSCERNEARAYINNVDEAMLEYYRVFVKQIKPLPPEPQL